MKSTSSTYLWLAIAGAFWLFGAVAMYAFATPGRGPGSTAFPWGLPLACFAALAASAVDLAAMKRWPQAATIALGLGSVVVGLALMWAAAARWILPLSPLSCQERGQGVRLPHAY